ncbi:MAG: nucleotidyltransferase domain-containing protein [Acidimicrobiales bacterium]
MEDAGGAVLPGDRARIWARRRAEREALLSLGRELGRRLSLTGIQAVVVFGSVARGDFNLWSDVDVLVVADDLPDRLLERLSLVNGLVPGTQALAWTPAELAAKLRRGDPIAVEAYRCGVVVRGALPDVAGGREPLPGGRNPLLEAPEGRVIGTRGYGGPPMEPRP